MNKTQWLACSLVSLAALLAACQQPEPSAPEPLTTEETEALLNQLPPLSHPAAEAASSERADAPPPPQASATAEPAFQSPGKPPAAVDQPLTLERFTPQGEVERARLISLTFSEPMVAIGAHKEQPIPPISVQPAVEGQWRWLDTLSLVFEPRADALPMATEYTITLDDTVRSLAGQPLTEGHTWRFATPALEITQSYPGENQPLTQQPVLVLVFNQPIDADAVIPQLQIQLADDEHVAQTWPVRAADPSLIEQDLYQAAELIERLEDDHWVAVTPREPLPKNRTFTLALAAGTNAASGERVTQQAQTRPLRTAGPLALEPNPCPEDDPCRPEGGLRLTLTNPLSDDWRDDLLSLSPDVPELSINHYGNRLYLRGQFAPETRYTVTLKAGSKDQFGQTLQDDVSVEQFTDAFNPMLQLPGGQLVTLPSNQGAELPIYSRNTQRISVELRQVTPEDWSTFADYKPDPNDAQDNPPTLPGTVTTRFSLDLDDSGRAITTTNIPLASALNEDGLGHVIVTLRAAKQNDEHEAIRSRYPRHTWVQISNLGISTYTDARNITAWVTHLDTGQPVEGAQLRHNNENANQEVYTNAEGIAVLPATALAAHDGERNGERNGTAAHSTSVTPSLLSLGTDQLLVPDLNRYRPWLYDNGAQLPALIFTDRGLYQPGETVHLKGVVRQLNAGPEGDIALPSSVSHGQWRAYDGQSNEVAEGRIELNPLGAFDLRFTLPESAASGRGHVELHLLHHDAEHEAGPSNKKTRLYQAFQIEEYRRPEYEVSTTLGDGDYIAHNNLNAEVTARYYSGGPLPNAPVQWQVSLNRAHFAPPGWNAYVFGQWRSIGYPSMWPMPEPEVWRKSFAGTTNGEGQHTLALKPNEQLAMHDLRHAHRLTAEASVTDVNRQQWSSRSERLIHAANRYVGLRTENRFASTDEAVTVQWVVVDIDGTRTDQAAPELTVERLVWENNEWTAADTLPCQKRGEETCVFTPEKAGQYRLTASIHDEQQRINETQMTLWVAGQDAAFFPTPGNTKPAVQLIPDQESYHPGDTARLHIQAPFSDSSSSHALVTVQRQGLKAHYPIVLENGQHTMALPIQTTDTPGLTVHVEAINENRTGRLPSYHTGMVQLPVSTESRTLNVTVDADQARLKPGQEVTTTLSVKDHNGRAFGEGEVTLYAVDDSVLALTGYTTPNALDAFYRDRPLGVTTYHSRFGLLETPEDEVLVSGRFAEKASARFAADTAAQQGQNGARLRTHFDPLATFQSTVSLDHNGEAEVSFTLPDTLTRYRLIAVAYGEQQFGTGESQLTVGLPLMVRPSLPRFLNLGDQAELPVVVQNTTDQPMTVRLALRAHNLSVIGEPGQRLIVPAQDRREIRFSAEPLHVGPAMVQVIVESDDHQDAAEISLPVERPATREAFAQYGSLTEGNTFLEIAVPDDVYEDFGGLSVTTSSSQFQSLSDAFLYLLDYPYGGSEQLASRLMAITALNDLLGEFHAEGLPEPEAIEQSVSDILERLQQLQNRDGGWGFWRRDGQSYPWLSVHVAHALLRTQSAGYSVEPSLQDAALAYNREVAQHLPDTLHAKAANSVQAYSIYVQSLNASDSVTQAVQLFDRAEEDALSLEAMGWLLSAVGQADTAQAMREEIHRRLNNQLRETAATAQFVDEYPQDGHWVLYGSRRTDAVVLEALLAEQPDGALVEKLARGLLNERRNGHWGNTQENVFALLALKRYFLTRENETPDLTFRAWLGGAYLGEKAFQGRQTEPQISHLSMADLKADLSAKMKDTGGETSTLALQHEGQGRVYYRVGLQYAPADLQLEAASHGFRVTRTYQPINDPADVKQAEDGTWDIRAGAAVKVQLTMTVPARRHHVVLTDYMPAGFEALNPALQNTAQPAQSTPGLIARRAAFWPTQWYQHQQLRNERADAFSTELEAGVYTYEYTVLATTPGVFIAPPALAEEMYQPETFGRAATDVVRVGEQP